MEKRRQRQIMVDENNLGMYEGLCKDCGVRYMFPIEEESIFLCNSCIKKKYRKEMEIDRYQLEIISETQPLRLEKWHSVFIIMKDIVSGLDQELKAKKAELDGEIRSCPTDLLEESYGIPKITESAISQAIERHSDYTNILSLYREAIKRRDTIMGAVEGYRDRSSMIKTLKDLFTSQYFDRTESISLRKTEEKIASTVKVPKPLKRRKD